ncbi:unnamed protein product [Calypogeia fissa]
MAAALGSAANIKELLNQVRVDPAVRAVRELLLELPVTQVSAALASTSIKDRGCSRRERGASFNSSASFSMETAAEGGLAWRSEKSSLRDEEPVPNSVMVHANTWS